MPHLNKEQKRLIHMEVNEMLIKGTVLTCSQNRDGPFLSNLFLVGNKDAVYPPVINFNKYI